MELLEHDEIPFGVYYSDVKTSDPRRLVGHIDSTLIFEKFGFEKTPIFVTFEWPTIQPDGHVEKIANRLDLWIDRT